MADEAEKLINISLTKISESRTIRRGGSSLHKHLLINTVLTKARSAYFEAWYTGDGETVALMDPKTGRFVNLNSSFQELDFPLDDEDNDELLEDPLADPPTAFEQASAFIDENESLNNPESITMMESQKMMSDGSEQVTSASGSCNNNLIDPRFFVEVGTENESDIIDLPSDILNCVEKLGDMNHHHINFSSSDDDSLSSASSSSSSVMRDLTATSTGAQNGLIVKTVSINCDDQDSVTHHQSSQLTYLDLDSATRSVSKFETDEPNNNNSGSSDLMSYHHLNDESDNDRLSVQVQSSGTSPNYPSSNKRRRDWNEEEESETEVKSTNQFQFSEELNEKLKRNGLSITNVANKRLRFSPPEEEESSNYFSIATSNEKSKTNQPSSFPAVVVKDGEFRTKKSHFDEDDEQEQTNDSDDDPFLGDALGQSPLDRNNDQPINTGRRSDQRVPSSGSSSSDEDGETENCMEVDQICNLVQYISFNKQINSQQQSHQLISSPSIINISSTSSEGVTTSSSSSSGGLLMRSMSSPDLFGLKASSSSSSRSTGSGHHLLLSSSSANNNAKDLFSSYSKNGNSGHVSQHRILTMTV